MDIDSSSARALRTDCLFMDIMLLLAMRTMRNLARSAIVREDAIPALLRLVVLF